MDADKRIKFLTDAAMLFIPVLVRMILSRTKRVRPVPVEDEPAEGLDIHPEFRGG